jgi:hypothetical protein
MNWKGCGRKRYSTNTILLFSWRDWGKPGNAWLRKLVSRLRFEPRISRDSIFVYKLIVAQVMVKFRTTLYESWSFITVFTRSLHWTLSCASLIHSHKHCSCYACYKARDVKITNALLAACFLAGFLLGLFFDPEDGSDMFLRNVGWLSTD